MTSLPKPYDLVRRAKALAALDLILSPDWEYRHYSFNSVWSSSEQMASMRDGCGDEWWIIFSACGWAALKGLAHESQAWSKGGRALSMAIQKSFPAELYEFINEPAFCWPTTSFGYFYLPANGSWLRANDFTPFSLIEAGDEYLLRHLTGSPSDYVLFADEYYETSVPLSLVKDVFCGKPITNEIVSGLNPEITLDDIAKELSSEIGYQCVTVQRIPDGLRLVSPEQVFGIVEIGYRRVCPVEEDGFEEFERVLVVTFRGGREREVDGKSLSSVERLAAEVMCGEDAVFWLHKII